MAMPPVPPSPRTCSASRPVWASCSTTTRTRWIRSPVSKRFTTGAWESAFLDDLKKLGVYDRAIVIVLSDHGEGLGDHGEEQHGVLLYRETLHVPLLVKLPGGFGAGRRVAAPVQLSGLLPPVPPPPALPPP